MRILTSIGLVIGIGALAIFVSQDERASIFLGLRPDPVQPDWTAIAAWPTAETTKVEAQPDPNRRITAIVLDDSGSMSADMDAAKQAIIDTLDAMQGTDRVAVIALNAGVVLPFTSVS